MFPWGRVMSAGDDGAAWEGSFPLVGDTMITDVRSWLVGDQIRFTGIDLEGQTVPTDTPELGWYEPDYVCTATWEFAN